MTIYNETPVDIIIDDTIDWGGSPAAPVVDAHRGETRPAPRGSGRRRPYRPASEYFVAPGTDTPAGAAASTYSDGPGHSIYDARAASRAAGRSTKRHLPGDGVGANGSDFLGTPPADPSGNPHAADRSVVLREPWRFDDKWTPKTSTKAVFSAKRKRGKHGGDIIDPGAITPEALRHPKLLTQRAAELGLPITEYDTSLSMAIRRMDGGREMFLRFVCLAAADADDDAIKFLTTLRELKPYEQRSCSFDLVCLAAGVSPVVLLKTVVGVAFESHVDTGNLIAAAAHPQIVETAIKSAKRVNSDIGQRDRAALLTHHGFNPTPKGATININANANATAAAAATTSADASVPKFLSAANVASAARETVQRQLSDGPLVLDVTPISIPVHEEV